MFIHTIESLEEFEDYIKQLNEKFGLKSETYTEVMNAINKERKKLRTTISNSAAPNSTLLKIQCNVCGRTEEEMTDMTSRCGVSACPN